VPVRNPGVVVTREIVDALRSLAGHVFWKARSACWISSSSTPLKSRHPIRWTDTYLLALAAANEGQLATFDRRLSVKTVSRGRAALYVIDG
jgi:uncharacterized protein